MNYSGNSCFKAASIFPSGLRGLIIFLAAVSFVSCSNERSGPVREVTFEVVLPAVSRDSAVFLSGNTEETGNWKADGVKLDRGSDGIWRKTLLLEDGIQFEYKFTHGTWATEALGKDNKIPQNYRLKAIKDTVITVFIERWLSQSTPGHMSFPSNALDNPMQVYFLTDEWKYQAGDDTLWKEPGFDDSNWKTGNTVTIPNGAAGSGWNGIGWFRLHLNPDTALTEIPLTLGINQIGASEIYLNGKLIKKTGRIGNPPEAETAAFYREPVTITFNSGHNQLLAVRYSTYSTRKVIEYAKNIGFRTWISRPETYFNEAQNFVRGILYEQMIFAVVPLILAVLHFLFFIFYRQNKTNLFYALCLLSYSAAIFLWSNGSLSNSPIKMDLYSRISSSINPFIIMFGALTMLKTEIRRINAGVLLNIAAAVIISILNFSLSGPFPGYSFYAYFVLTLLQLAFYFKSRPKERSNFKFTGTGFAILSILFLYNIIIDIGLIRPLFGVVIKMEFGMLALILANSISLSLGFSKTNRDLEKRLKEVQLLSEKTIEQERQARETEIARKLLEADNLRKTNELEEARQIQLSMLPKSLPVLREASLEAYMKTASEVGGDYYDFKIASDGSLVCAIGDATGHGTKAGYMVIAAKVLFNELSNFDDPSGAFRKFTETIKQMNFNKLYLGMTLLKLKNEKLDIISAGMPPVLIYRKECKIVEEVIIKAMPLGSFSDFPYQVKELQAAEGDIILMLSDGFIEQFNEKKEMLGLKAAEDILLSNAGRTPREIIDMLLERFEKWRGTVPQQDDVTFIVIKKK